MVEALEEPLGGGGFFSPAAGFGVGEERLGVGPLGGQDGQEGGTGPEAGAVLADVGIRAAALSGGAQAVAAGEPGLDQRRALPAPVLAGCNGGAPPPCPPRRRGNRSAGFRRGGASLVGGTAVR